MGKPQKRASPPTQESAGEVKCPTQSLSCQDSDYSLVDSLIFIDSQIYRYRTINSCINGSHTDESHMDVVANIALVVESEKRLFQVTAVS